MEKIICGIQQMGIGVPDVQEIWKWYRKFFGINIRVFEDAAEAPLMTIYTGGKVHSRTASLALSMESGGGFEIWQYTSRVPQPATFVPQLGDLGIFIAKIKCKDVVLAYKTLKNKGVTFTNLGIDRDLESWTMNISWTPFGNRESWFFFIGVKSGILRDLKYEKRREPDKRL